MSFINTIDQLGDEVVLGSIIDGSIVELKDDMLTTITKNEAFRNMQSLVSVDLPNLTSICTYAFNGCAQLTFVNVPNLTNLPKSIFAGTGISKFDSSKVTNIASNVFRDSTLNTLILRSNTMCILESYYNLWGTPIYNRKGYIYVPKALLSDDDATMDYRRATNWSTYANQFRALEDYTVDGTTTGELDETKI